MTGDPFGDDPHGDDLFAFRDDELDPLEGCGLALVVGVALAGLFGMILALAYWITR